MGILQSFGGDFGFGTVAFCARRCLRGGMMKAVGNSEVEPMMRTRCAAAVAMFVCAWTLSGSPALAQHSPEAVLGAVVGVRSTVPPDARTAHSLGIERSGSGVVIDDDGLVLTIGYLILEASSVTLVAGEGPGVGAGIVAYDHATGFGLVRAAKPLGVAPLEIGDSAALRVGDPVLAISYGGAKGMRPARVVDRREFAGYWEYLLEDAIFVSPPHPFFGGSALVGMEGRLLGIGSLVVNDAIRGQNPVPGNMFVPINILKPIIESLITTGRDPTPRRPWIGVYTEEFQGYVFVTRVADQGPAANAGIRPDDVILRVAGTPVTDMAGLYRAMWGLGEAGVAVPLTVLRGSEIHAIVVKSTNRYTWLRLASGRVAAAW